MSLVQIPPSVYAHIENAGSNQDTWTTITQRRFLPGMGLTFAFVFTEFLLYAFGGLSKRLEWMKMISIFNYWDYSSVIIDGFFKVGDFIVLTILAIALLIIGMWIFEKKDIPA